MKRLTGRRDGRAYIVGCPDFALPKIAGLIIQQTVDRLAAIEDILGDEYDLDELKEVIQAKREGRCVVLPCKIGDIVYEIRYTAENDRQRKYARKRFDHSVSGCTWRMREQPEMCYVSEKKCAKSDFEFMGRTVFLTRAEAEEALRREQDEQIKP